MQGTYNIPLKELIEQLDLENCTPEIDTENVFITQNDINRPALQLAGYFDYYDSKNTDNRPCRTHLYAAKGHRVQCCNDGKDNGRRR